MTTSLLRVGVEATFSPCKNKFVCRIFLFLRAFHFRHCLFILSLCLATRGTDDPSVSSPARSLGVSHHEQSLKNLLFSLIHLS
ncbi:hypothetical protein K439DRAFT_1190343 [Ramaria rubella]|nr:hypothetical protein K439DRAFT_1190343 [Ramaria rubella]